MMSSCWSWGEEAVLSVLPRVEQLSSDKEMVIRQAIAEVLGPFAKYLLETMTPFEYEFPADAPPIDLTAVNDPHQMEVAHSRKGTLSPSPSTAPDAHDEAEGKEANNSTANIDAHSGSLSPSRSGSSSGSDGGGGQRMSGKVRAHYVMITELLPLIKEMLKDSMEVRQGAGSSLIVIAELLNQEQVYEHILKIVLHMAHDDSDDQKITALPVLNHPLSLSPFDWRPISGCCSRPIPLNMRCLVKW